MKRILFIILGLVLVVSHGMSQEWDGEKSVYENLKEQSYLMSSSEPIQLFQALHAAEEPNTERFDKLLDKLDSKAKKKNYTEWFLGEVFYKVHQYLLKNYTKHSSFNQMIQSGDYDCVSGSALYALLLERYGFSYDIIETDFHVFVLVKDQDKTYVLESTEPREGFIKDQEEVKAYIASFKPKVNPRKKIMSELAGLSAETEEGKTIYSSISLKELAGLQYYNDAIHHFNQGKAVTAEKQLIKAKQIYPSDRIRLFYEYLSERNNSDKNLAGR
ncbi:hypothetical protein KZP23_01375 [Echinicola marina]|uniref:hypothetical protein n=1 Tax=Echinicola marina TaxID=2859768 RepID=UPI001CF67451|nr:hypothetical protein [Echinicola marina]UCS93717.1 hypothetical protein KZP23_01375 [Echinicola marina]